MSTFLELCQDTRRECGITASGPTGVTNQTGELERVVNWVKQSWTELQGRHANWRWMRSEFTVNTVADDDAYAYGDATDVDAADVVSRFSHWLVDDRDSPPKIYLQSAGVGTEGWLVYIDWNSFKRLYRRGTQNSGYPVHISVDPQNRLVLGPKPNGVYVVSGDYQKSAQILAASGDIPEMPTQYHAVVQYRAMEKYAGYESAQEVMSRALREGSRLMRQLEVNQLPPPTFAPPLA